LSPWSRTSPV